MGRRLKVRDFGTSLNFTASTNRVDLGVDFVGVGDITFSCWFKSTITTSSNRRLFTNGSTYLVFEPVSKRFRVSSDGGTTNTTTPNNSASENFWQFVTITRTSAGVVNHYINGVLSGAADQSSNTPVAASTNLFLGNTTNAPVAKMDGARFFNRILTVAEIQDLYYDMKLPTDSATSMLAEYMFQEGGGSTAYDTSGNGRNGTITGATYSPDVPVRGRLTVQPATRCIDFSAATDELDVGADWIGTGDVSVSTWVKPRSIGATGGRIVDNGKFVYSLNTLGRIQFSSDNSTFVQSSSNSWKTPSPDWLFLTITRTAAGVANHYVNGLKSGTADQASGTPAAGTTNVIIGNRNAQDRNFNGKIANLIVHNKVLSQAEISALYYNGTVPDGALYNAKFDNNLTDDSVYHRTATATGTTYSTDVRDVRRTVISPATRTNLRTAGLSRSNV